MTRLIFAKDEQVINNNISINSSDYVYCYYEIFFSNFNSIKKDYPLTEEEIFEIERFIFDKSFNWCSGQGLFNDGVNFLDKFELLLFLEINPFLINLVKIHEIFSGKKSFPGGILVLDDGSPETGSIRTILDILKQEYAVIIVEKWKKPPRFGAFGLIKHLIKKVLATVRNPFKSPRFTGKSILICEQGGHKLTDNFIFKLINAGVRVISVYPSVLNVRKYFFNKYYYPLRRYFHRPVNLSLEEIKYPPIIFRGIDISDYFYFVFKKYLKEHYYSVTLTDRALRRIISKNSITEFIILFDRSPGLRVLIETCHQFGIKVSMIQHGVVCRDIFPPIAADRYLIWGEYTKRIYSPEELSRVEFLTVGTTNYEDIAEIKNLSSKSRTDFFKMFNLDPGRELIIFATQTNDWYVEENESLIHIKAILEEFRVNSNRDKYYMIIKVHPRDDEKPYGRLVKEFKLEGIV
ncbi:MAG TPA: hypothetical protein ENN73_03445, partial [Firmicutes bacterium]|nr:hypothetical protein [Bacillota bacterium]